MGIADLLEDLREDAPERVWSAAVRLARAGAVEGLAREEDEVKLRVKAGGHARPAEVYLWPEDEDAGCDCGLPEPCVHVCAATIAVHKGLKVGRSLPEPSNTYRVKVRYDFTRKGARLAVERVAMWPDGRTRPLKKTLAEEQLMAERGDVQAEALLATHTGGALPEEKLRRLLVFLEGASPATLDGKPVTLSRKPVRFVIRIRDEGQRFRVGLYRPAGLDDLFLGAALVGDTLHPTTYGKVPMDERRALHPRRDARVFQPDQVGWLVSEYIPRLRSYELPVETETDRLPDAGALEPRIQLHLQNVRDGLKVRPDLVYGDPPVARIRAGVLTKLGATVPVRDHGAERRLARRFEERMKLPVGHPKVLPPSDAADFLDRTIDKLGVEVVGDIDRRRFRVASTPVAASLDVEALGGDPSGPLSGGTPGGFRFDVRFRTEAGEASPTDVVRAWRAGRSLVPLLEGGYAPLPSDWMKEHGALLMELLEARDAQGTVDRAATAALVELLEGTEGDVPPDLSRLRSFLEAGEGLPEAPVPDDFQADLRPYQLVGYRWVRFLRDMHLHGILADDMGLGKTVQALAALSATPGPHLVVAPTSVMSNWEREAQRFAPQLKVNLFHGPSRVLDPTADITLTSYALLRIDLDKLSEVDWAYMVLDEAQAIKNPRSQTARSARAVGARHRLALTGTPVENHLDELWSLFRFLMPGLLGTQQTFRERFVKPIEVGDVRARKNLHARVRPYVLRRLKRQVARDLPALTELVVKCEMGTAQRRVYDTVRQAARRDVIDLLGGPDAPGTMQILEALLRMRQACCDPSLLPGQSAGQAGSAKLDRLEEMLVDLVVDGHKSLVFSQWTSLLDRVEPRLDGLGIRWVRLDGSTRDRQKVIDEFQSDGGPAVFLLSLKAGGTGLNLTAADYVFHLDPWWNPAVQQQATDRAHRIGQDKPVVSCKFVASDSIEERILALQEAKKELADAVLGTEGGWVRALDAEELRALFADI